VEIAKRWKELSDYKKTSHHNEALEVTFIKTRRYSMMLVTATRRQFSEQVTLKISAFS
jgi:hypothetical protein